MDGRNHLRSRLLVVVVWSAIPLAAIYRFVGWHGILAMTLILNSKIVWRMMLQRNPSYIYILNAQMRLCNLSLFILLWQLVSQLLYPEKPFVFEVDNVTMCLNKTQEWPLKVGHLCKDRAGTLLRWSGSVWEAWIPPLLDWKKI